MTCLIRIDADLFWETVDCKFCAAHQFNKNVRFLAYANIEIFDGRDFNARIGKKHKLSHIFFFKSFLLN